MQAKYDQTMREQQSQLEKEDLSDMVAEHAAKQKVSSHLLAFLWIFVRNFKVNIYTFRGSNFVISCFCFLFQWSSTHKGKNLLY